MLSACNREDVLYSNTALQDYLNEHRELLLYTFYVSLSDDVTVVAISENELVFTFELTDEEYREIDEFAQGLDVDRSALELLDRALYNKWIQATLMADKIRDEIGVDEVRITIIYTVEGSELLSESFASGDFD